MVSLDRQITVY